MQNTNMPVPTFIVGHVSSNEKSSIFLSLNGLGEKYLDDVQIFFCQKQAEEEAERLNEKFSLNIGVYKVVLEKV